MGVGHRTGSPQGKSELSMGGFMSKVVFCDVGKSGARRSLPLLEMVARMSRSGLAVQPCRGTGGAGAALVPAM